MQAGLRLAATVVTSGALALTGCGLGIQPNGALLASAASSSASATATTASGGGSATTSSTGTSSSSSSTSSGGGSSESSGTDDTASSSTSGTQDSGSTQGATAMAKAGSSVSVQIALSAAKTTLQAGASTTLTTRLTGTSLSRVSFSVRCSTISGASCGTVTASKFTAPATVPSDGRVTVTAVSADAATAATSITFLIQTSITQDAATRFLRQSTFGPTPALVAQVQQLGYAAFLDQQFALPATHYSLLQWWQQQRFAIIRNEIQNDDQLRQRVSLALSEIIVASNFGQTADQSAYPLWLNTLQDDAFGLYGTVLKDTIKTPALAAFLTNIGNNSTSDPNQHISQNLARELLQLFSVGPYLLNPDGSLQTDSQGNALPAYDNTVVDGVSRALTGWNYMSCTAPVACPWHAPLVAIEANHDHTTKRLLNGATSTAGASASDDLDAVVNGLVQHANAGPFVSKRLIQALVTSNPSTSYVRRIAAVFANDGNGKVGNLQAVVRAILLDSEARAADTATATTTSGHLEEPELYVASVVRTLGGTMQANLASPPQGEDSPGPWAAQDAVTLEYWAGAMGQQPLYAPSVFNYYSFENRLSNTTTLAPELELETATTSISRANFVNDVLYGGLTALSANVSGLLPTTANTPATIVDGLNHLLTGGRISSTETSLITDAVLAVPGTNRDQQIRQALYLLFTCPEYVVIQ